MSEGITKIGDNTYYFTEYGSKYYDKTDDYSLGKLKVGSIEGADARYYSNSSGVLLSGWRKFYDGKDTGTTKDDTYTWRYFNDEENGFSELAEYEPFIASGPGALAVC